jgi:hypothetical protein
MIMEQPSIALLKKHLEHQLEWLMVLEEYKKHVDDPYVKSTLSFLIEDTQEAIAKISSRLRQLGTPTGQMQEDIEYKRLYQARSRRYLADKIRFIWQGLKYQLQWYQAEVKGLREDADSQALFVALAEQNRMRLERWEKLMVEMKVSFSE